MHLQQDAATLFLGLGLVKSRANRLVKHRLETFLSQRRALKVVNGADLLHAVLSLLGRDDVQALRLERRDRAGVVAQVALGADQDEWYAWCMVLDLREPLRLHIVERVRRNDREADQKHIRLRVREWAKTVVVLLPGGVPQAQVDGFAINHHVGTVVVEHGRDVLARESICSVRNQQTRLADRTITNNDALDVLHVIVGSLLSL